MAGSSKAVEYKAVLGALVVAVVVLLVGIDIWQNSRSSESEPEAAATTESSSAITTPAPEPAPSVCGTARSVTVEESTPVVWKLVRESDATTTACPRITLYRDDEPQSNFELSEGVTFIDGDDGLWTYVDGGEAKAEDQTVPNENLAQVWLIARTTDGHTVTANLGDGNLALE